LFIGFVKTDKSEFVLLGDFNVNFIDTKVNNDKAKKRKLLKVTNSHHLDQQINTPARITEKSSTLIDLLFTNTSHRVIDKGVISSPLSDHCLIFCVMKSGVPKAPGRTIEYRSYKHYSKQEFLKDLRDIDWDQALNKEDIDSAVGCWNKLFTNVADSHAPIRKSRIKGVHSPWMNARLSEAMHQRDFYHRKALKSKASHHWSRYKKLSNYVNREIKRCKSEYYTTLITENKSNPSALWKTLNDITSRKERTPISCIEADGVQYFDRKSISKILNDHFSTIGTKLAQKLKSYSSLFFSKSPENFHSLQKFVLEPIAEDFVLRQLKQLKTNKAIDNVRTRQCQRAPFERFSLSS